MSTHPPHGAHQPGRPHLLTDALGRTFPSLNSPPSAHHPTAPAEQVVHSCGCHASPEARRSSRHPMAVYVAGGALGIGLLIALLLTIAVVATAVALGAVAVAVCAVVLRSLLSGERYRRR